MGLHHIGEIFDYVDSNNSSNNDKSNNDDGTHNDLLDQG